MKAISIGRTFKIYDDSLKTYDALPSQVYSVRFSQMEGFYLEKHSDIEIKEEKIYGVHPEKLEKVLKSFIVSDRNLGVILSGAKGIGKSLFAKLLSVKAVEHNYPVIIIDTAYPGIASYIEDIEQECVIVFDEFDKTFAKRGDNQDPQTELLSLFDGFAQGKKLFVITCNDIRYLNDYIVNRPGRFRYHLRFKYPDALEVRAYMQDKIKEEYWSEIDKVVAFSRKVDLNYDCLRAIAIELDTGDKFEELIQDLNIINMKEETYNLTLHYEDGTTLTADNSRLDIFSNEKAIEYFYDSKGRNIVDISFVPKKAIFNTGDFKHYIQADNLYLDYETADAEESVISEYKKLLPKYIEIEKDKGRDFHYTV